MSLVEREVGMSSYKILRGDKVVVDSYTPKDMPGGNRRISVYEKAVKEAEEIIKSAEMKKESIEMEAYNRGLLQGQKEGQKMVAKRLEPLFSTLKNAIEELSRAREALMERHEKDIIELACLIAEKVVHRKIQISPEIVMDTVKDACKHLMDHDDVRLRLHPSDYEYLREIEEILRRHVSDIKGVTVLEDSGIERGGVILETSFGEIDATIRSQIDQIRDALLEED